MISWQRWCWGKVWIALSLSLMLPSLALARQDEDCKALFAKGRFQETITCYCKRQKTGRSTPYHIHQLAKTHERLALQEKGKPLGWLHQEQAYLWYRVYVQQERAPIISQHLLPKLKRSLRYMKLSARLQPKRPNAQLLLETAHLRCRASFPLQQGTCAFRRRSPASQWGCLAPYTYSRLRLTRGAFSFLPGVVKMSVSAPQYISYKQKITAQANTHRVETIALLPAPPAPKAKANTKPPTMLWASALIAAGAALALTGAIATGVLANNELTQAYNKAYQSPNWLPNQRRAESLQTGSIILYTSSGVLVTVAAGLLFVHLAQPKTPKQRLTQTPPVPSSPLYTSSQ